MTPEQIEKERGKFESWAIKHCYLNRDKDGSYTYAATQMSFEAWLARAEQPAWISTKDRLPPHGGNVVFVYSNPEDLIDPEEDVYSDELLADVGYCNHKHFGFVGAELLIPREDVTHWQPLPTPPKAE